MKPSHTEATFHAFSTGKNSTMPEADVDAFKSMEMELRSLKQEVEISQQKHLEELEETIMNYEDKLSSLTDQLEKVKSSTGDGQQIGGESLRDGPPVGGEPPGDGDEDSRGDDNSNKITSLEKEVLLYQRELESALSTQEEELERSEVLQIEIENLRVSSLFRFAADEARQFSKESVLTKTH